MAAVSTGIRTAPAPPARKIAGNGTPDAAWQAWPGLANLPPVTVSQLVAPGQRAVIVAPHPDDEVLACGGLLQQLAIQGSEVLIVAASDGDASHPGSRMFSNAELARLRPAETEAALQCLLHGGLPLPQLLRARLPDGAIGDHMSQLQTVLASVLHPGDVVFVTWRQDGHPDHEACGLAAMAAARQRGASVIEMPIWAWHWAAPGESRVPWHSARMLALTPLQVQRKRQAIACYTTQLQDDYSTGRAAILAPHVLARLTHPYEIYFL